MSAAIEKIKALISAALDSYSDRGDGTISHGALDGLYAALAEAEKAQPAPEPQDWRKLALQFDAQRMAAMAHLRTLLTFPDTHADAARKFLSAAPSDQIAAGPKAQPGARCDKRGCNCATWLAAGCAWDGVEPLPAQPASPERKPLTDEQISKGCNYAIELSNEIERAAFRKGVKFAEDAHRIATTQEPRT